MKQVIKESLKKYTIFILIVIIISVISEILLTLPSNFIGKIINLIGEATINKEKIQIYALGIIIAMLGFLTLAVIRRKCFIYATRNFRVDLQESVFKQFLKLPLSNLQEIKNGELMTLLTKDTRIVHDALFIILNRLIRVVFSFIINFYTMARATNFKLTITIFIPLVAAIILELKIRIHIEKSFQEAGKEYTYFSEFIQESTDSIRTTKAYSEEKYQNEKFFQKNNRVRKSNIKVDINSLILNSVVDICMGISYGLSLILGAKLIQNGEIGVGEFVSFNGYIGLLRFPISSVPRIFYKLKKAQVSYQRLDKIFDIEPEEVSGDNQLQIKGEIKIKNLDYIYPNTEKKVLENINIDINKGQTIGIIGKLGSGKTTLMNLLLKLYKVPNGCIEIDSKDINEIDSNYLRENICYITQEHFLFSATIKDNITLFDESFQDEEIDLSTKKSMLFDELKNMKNSINTVIGEKGIDLSGGQKQRVIISRAFLFNSKIIIFDDTFSALDNKTEEAVLNNIKEITQDKTCIIISNRISDIKDADRIFVLDNGKILQEGVHTELINKEGLYKKIYDGQLSRAERQGINA